uniref:Uncharacterized protein n=1 Tax=Aureoumbra lagunensis TaxID=44058 RepID=A0A7S3JPR7_9STRA
MVKALIEANPRSCEQAGPRGWNCLHYWANRDPNDTHSQAILNELLATHSGRKALRIPDAKGELPLHLFVKTCSAYKFAKEEEEFHGGLTADYSDDDSTADYSDDDSSANEIREKESTYSFLGLGSKKNNKINDNSLKEIDDTSDSGWDTRRPLVLARKLLTTYTDSWRIKSNDGTTPMDLAPVEIKELFHEFIQECEMVQARKRAKIRQQLAQEKKNSLKIPPLPIVIDSGNDALLLSILSEKANAGARNNKAITKRKLQQQLNECAASLRDLVIADDSYQGGTLLHRLLRRTNHNVSSEALRALLSAAPEACTITDKSQWTCLHLLVRRACDDHSIGTAGNLKRLARASPEAALVLGGGPRRNWTPLHVLCTMLSRHNCQRPPATGEERKTFDDRILSVFKTLLQIGGVSARLLKDARGKTAYDILPVAGYYDVFRGLCFPPEDDALQKEEEAFFAQKVRRKSSCSVQSILATNIEGSTFKPEEKRDENKVSRQRRPVRKISRRALIHDAPCVSLNLPGLELSQVSRPSTPQAVESLPEVIVKARPASERDTLHKAKAREAERWITDQVRRQRAAESAKLRIERAERRAHLKANAQAKRKARREKRQLEDNFTDVSMMSRAGRRRHSSNCIDEEISKASQLDGLSSQPTISPQTSVYSPTFDIVASPISHLDYSLSPTTTQK